MVDNRYPTGRPPHRPSAALRAAAMAVAAALLAPGPAFAAGADDLARTIEQNLTGIEFRLDVSPERVGADLDEQKRRLRLLREQAPDHPMVPELAQQVERLEGLLAERIGEGSAPAGAATSGATTASELLGPRTAPGEVDDRLQEVERRLAAAEAGMLQGQTDAAAEQLGEAEGIMAEVEGDYGDQIPAGHVPLIMAKERLGALKEQLAAKQR